MTDHDHGLRRLVEEGALVSRRPPRAELRRRILRRRAHRSVAAAVLLSAVAGAALTLAAHAGFGTTASGTSTSRPTSPPLSTTAYATLAIHPHALAPGDTLTLSGAGCDPRAKVTYELDSSWVAGAVTADQNGVFITQIKIPADNATGTATLSGMCKSPTGTLQFAGTIRINKR